jgi:hypothetical protein
MRKRVVIGTVLALVVGACTASGGTPGSTPEATDPSVAGTGGVGIGGGIGPFLINFDSCDALLDHIQEEAAERVGPYGLDTSGWPWVWMEGGVALDAMSEETMAASGRETLPATGDDGSGQAAFTGTNTQEADVDEPDIVKTDGARILTLVDNVFTYVDVTGDEPVVRDRIRLDEGWGHELFIAGDRAFAFTNEGSWGGPILFDGDAIGTRPAPEEWRPTATVTEIDLSDPDALTLAAVLRIEGQYLSARAVGDTVRMAVTSGPDDLPWLYPAGPEGEERAEEANRATVLATTIEDWIPRYEVLDATGEVVGEGLLLDCTSVSHPEEFSGFDMVSVLTFDLTRELGDGDGVGVLAGGQTVYASTDRFYVATTKWVAPDVEDEAELRVWSEDYTTQIHAFDNTGTGTARYLASGEVPGSLLNQFSLDEYDGYLRVVTTDGSPWNADNESETVLTVLAENGDALEEVGRVGGLGRGEALYAVRLLDEVGFAVTFEQVDPFYVLDLSDPANPTVAGELKIPGFSTYLHPIGEDLVLGIGQNATEGGMITGLKVSLFSVADAAEPAELATWTMDDANSPVEYDHRAFQYLPDRRVAILPALSWRGDFNGAVLLEIGDETITELGRVTQLDPQEEPRSDCDEIDASAFGDDTELSWIARDGGRIQYCDGDDAGGYGTWYCDRIPVADMAGWGLDEEAVETMLTEIGGDGSGVVEMCWPDDVGWAQQIQRSLVISDSLWTLSTSTLQANDLTTLDIETRLTLR